MFVSKLLFCVSVLSTSQITLARTGRRCFDCVSIASCKSGLDFARKLRDGTLPPESKQTILNAFCGFDKNNDRIPKVCCADFSKNIQTLVKNNDTIDPIENHRNIGLLPTFCGDIRESRLLRRRIANLYEFPWMALIAYNTNTGLEFKCAGSIINSRYILTAAHCVISAGRLRKIAGVRVGEYDYSTSVDCQGYSEDDMICESNVQDLEVEEIIPHERFTGRQPIESDIALLRVKKAITMTNNAAPVCLPVYSSLRNSDLAGKNGLVVGWGLTDGRAYSTKPMKVDVSILTGDACDHYYKRYKHQRTSIMETSFCAGENMYDPCEGDFGGPLMMESYYNDSIRMVEFGIVSYGPKQCGSAFPGVYTDVRKYMKWMLDNMRE